MRSRFVEVAVTRLGKSSGQLEIVRRVVRRGDVVFDVGAHTGDFTTLFAHLVGPDGRVHAFEPVPPTFEKLRRKVRIARVHDRVVLNRCALSDSLGRSVIYVPGDDLTQAALVSHHFASWSSGPVASYDCRLQTLDNYALINKIHAVDFVKIDVEGAETLVIKGMRNVLANSAPLVMLEVFPPWMRDFGFTPRDLFSLLEKAGYAFYFIEKDRLVACQDAVDVWGLVRFPDSLDFICLIPDVHRDRVRFPTGGS